jgi:23S rRNA (guanosine2251-2'-O)-methyltransferase
MFIILHNIRSAYNVGAIFRTADATGVKRVYLTGYTPRPTDRFGRNQAEISKTSLGASETVPWQGGDLKEIVANLNTKGVRVVGVEQTKNSLSLPEFKPPKLVAYIFGNEVTGLEATDLKLVNDKLEIPMLGSKESLNVSVAAGVVLYHDIFTRQ